MSSSSIDEQDSSKKHIVLFDMDGTLTAPRKPIGTDTALLLRDLSQLADIGIVSGSPWEYIDQQMSSAWKRIGSLYPQCLLIMPCNGTQLIRWNNSLQNFEVVYDVNFKDHICEAYGKDVYIDYVKHILELQLTFMDEWEFKNLTGNFLSYRGSMINWSPVGRDAQDAEREAFIELDIKEDVRNTLRDALRVRLDASGLHGTDLNLGGSTSIDIHPTGWDKTHALRHCGDRQPWFVGDKCEPGGNDWSLWSALQPEGRSFSTTGPDQTMHIVREKIMPAIRKDM